MTLSAAPLASITVSRRKPGPSGSTNNVRRSARAAAGTPLTDEDRWPWLYLVAGWIHNHTVAGIPGIVTCSALKKVYRQKLAEAVGRPITFIHLYGSRDLLAARMADRKGHFMPISLLDSQLATIEVPGPEENALHLDVILPVDELIRRAKAYLTSANYNEEVKHVAS